jgi:GNAT superfamily N-acetyltransferase
VSRSPIVVREAEPEDATALLTVWSDILRRTSSPPRLSEAKAAVARAAADPEQRLVVAQVEGAVVGAALLTRSAPTPLHADDTVKVNHLQVLDEARKHGVGRALMVAAVEWAEDKGATTIMASAPSQSRDANRFLARLGLGSLATLRIASVASLRAGALPVEPPACARTDVRTSRTVAQVLAKRRSMRRAVNDPAS